MSKRNLIFVLALVGWEVALRLSRGATTTRLRFAWSGDVLGEFLPNQRLQSRTAPTVLTTSTPISIRPSSNCTRPWPVTPDGLADLPADMERAQRSLVGAT